MPTACDRHRNRSVAGDGAELLEDAGVHERLVWPAAFRGAGAPGSSVVSQCSNVKQRGNRSVDEPAIQESAQRLAKEGIRAWMDNGT